MITLEGAATMKRNAVVGLAFSLLILQGKALAQPDDRSGYNIAWYDEFNESELDLSKWTPANTNQPTNNSRQDYLPDQVSVANGNLVIKSENIASRGLPYRSGLVQSTALQKYGRWDVRAKLPTSKGMWPAIWLLADAPWPSEGEIDIMENRGNEPLLTSSAFHYGNSQPYEHNFVYAQQTSVHNSMDVNYHNSFHTYSVEWDPSQIRFYVDDVHHWTVRDRDVDGFLTNQVGEMRLIINTAIGGHFLDDPDDTTIWPQEFQIDYVHAYSKSATGPTLTFDNGGFEDGGGSLAQWTKFGDASNNVSSGHEQIASGEEALKLFGQFNGEANYSGVEQGISVSAGDELFASADAFIALGDSISGTDNRVYLKIDYYSELYGEFGADEYIGSDSIVLADGSSLNDQWFNKELLSIAPEDAVEARLAIVFEQQANASGAVYVDNVQLFVVPEPGGLIVLMGMGLATMLRRRRRA